MIKDGELKRFLSENGRKGGKAGTGKAKSRGSWRYYYKLAMKSAIARKAKKSA